MRALEEIDCEFVVRDDAGGISRTSRALGDVHATPAQVRGACARRRASTNESRDESESPVATASSVARAVRDAVFADGALTEVLRPGWRREEATTRSALAWHPRREILATADDGGRCVARDVSRDGKGGIRAHRGDENEENEDGETTTLRHRAHGRCARMAWRPGHGRALALVGASGTCVWTRERRGTRATSAVASETGALSPIDAAKVRAMAASGTSGKMFGYRWRLTMYNERGAHDAGPMAPPGGACAAESVSWSPCGRLLATCSRKSRVIHCWDVSAGTYSPLGGGAAGVSEVAFSPCGGYLFAAHVGEGFSVWRCDDMTCRKWSTNGREVTAVTWGEVKGKSGRAPVALVATRGSAKISAVHLSPRNAVSEIAAHVLPLELPDIVASSSDSGSSDRDIADMAWDATSSRLCLILRGGDKDGVVAVYATRTINIVSASLIGYFDSTDDDANARARATALRVSAPRPVDARRVRATIAVAFETGDVALVPLTFADPARAE